jgi:hypothetical protein
MKGNIVALTGAGRMLRTTCVLGKAYSRMIMRGRTLQSVIRVTAVAAKGMWSPLKYSMFPSKYTQRDLVLSVFNTVVYINKLTEVLKNLT